MNDTARDQLAQDTAEYIATHLAPKTAALHALPGVTVHYLYDERPPAGVADIKAALLDGRLWISWLDDRVTAAMRALHGEPTGGEEMGDEEMWAEEVAMMADCLPPVVPGAPDPFAP